MINNDILADTYSCAIYLSHSLLHSRKIFFGVTCQVFETKIIIMITIALIDVAVLQNYELHYTSAPPWMTEWLYLFLSQSSLFIKNQEDPAVAPLWGFRIYLLRPKASAVADLTWLDFFLSNSSFKNKKMSYFGNRLLRGICYKAVCMYPDCYSLV